MYEYEIVAIYFARKRMRRLMEVIERKVCIAIEEMRLKNSFWEAYVPGLGWRKVSDLLEGKYK
ncbi:MAG: hypothetical protein GXP46_01795 [Deferribacteres bacterium]|nr:hypothetical protein [Deferribacteres bacterium]